MFPKRSLKLALAAAVAGLAVGYLAHRNDRRAGAFATLQGIEWFLTAGGATLLMDVVRAALEDDEDLEVTERITRIHQTVTDHRPD